MENVKNENTTLAEETLIAMRRCGHHMHHNLPGREVDAAQVFGCLSAEELQKLHDLLEKCLGSWQEQKQ